MCISTTHASMYVIVALVLHAASAYHSSRFRVIYTGTTAYTFWAARTNCTASGGHLPVILTQKQHNDLLALYAGRTWLGGQDTNQEGVWRWTEGPAGLEKGGIGRIFHSGSCLQETCQWSPGQPGNQPNNNCLDMSGQFRWTDANCGNSRVNFVCQFPTTETNENIFVTIVSSSPSNESTRSITPTDISTMTTTNSGVVSISSATPSISVHQTATNSITRPEKTDTVTISITVSSYSLSVSPVSASLPIATNSTSPSDSVTHILTLSSPRTPTITKKKSRSATATHSSPSPTNSVSHKSIGTTALSQTRTLSLSRSRIGPSHSLSSSGTLSRSRSPTHRPSRSPSNTLSKTPSHSVSTSASSGTAPSVVASMTAHPLSHSNHQSTSPSARRSLSLPTSPTRTATLRSSRTSNERFSISHTQSTHSSSRSVAPPPSTTDSWTLSVTTTSPTANSGTSPSATNTDSMSLIRSPPKIPPSTTPKISPSTTPKISPSTTPKISPSTTPKINLSPSTRTETLIVTRRLNMYSTPTNTPIGSPSEKLTWTSTKSLSLTPSTILTTSRIPNKDVIILSSSQFTESRSSSADNLAQFFPPCAAAKSIPGNRYNVPDEGCIHCISGWKSFPCNVPGICYCVGRPFPVAHANPYTFCITSAAVDSNRSDLQCSRCAEKNYPFFPCDAASFGVLCMCSVFTAPGVPRPSVATFGSLIDLGIGSGALAPNRCPASGSLQNGTSRCECLDARRNPTMESPFHLREVDCADCTSTFYSNTSSFPCANLGGLQLCYCHTYRVLTVIDSIIVSYGPPIPTNIIPPIPTKLDLKYRLCNRSGAANCSVCSVPYHASSPYYFPCFFAPLYDGYDPCFVCLSTSTTPPLRDRNIGDAIVAVDVDNKLLYMLLLLLLIIPAALIIVFLVAGCRRATTAAAHSKEREWRSPQQMEDGLGDIFEGGMTPNPFMKPLHGDGAVGTSTVDGTEYRDQIDDHSGRTPIMDYVIVKDLDRDDPHKKEDASNSVFLTPSKDFTRASNIVSGIDAQMVSVAMSHHTPISVSLSCPRANDRDSVSRDVSGERQEGSTTAQGSRPRRKKSKTVSEERTTEEIVLPEFFGTSFE